MKRSIWILLVAMLLTLSMTAVAQEDPAPGEGGPVITGNSTGSINIGPLNPLRCQAEDCGFVSGFLFPALMGVTPGETFFTPGAPDSVARDWSLSEDGLVYTFNLRDDLYWTDGEQITAEDVAFTLNAILSNEIESTQSAALLDVVSSVEAVDDFTVQVTLTAPTCTALNNLNTAIVPAHVFSDFADMVGNEFDTNPTVTSGVFSFLGIEPGERIALVANQDYAFAPEGVIPQGLLYVDVPDTQVAFERFLAGELNIIGVPPINRDQIRGGNFQTIEYPANNWTYIGLNQADPANPQAGLDENGDLIDQGHHPLLGDQRVRRALQHALDVPAIIEGALEGEGVQMAANELPTSWAVNPDLAPIAYDPEMAAQLFEEAGFTLGEDGVLVANENALYAEPGTRFSIELLGAEGSEENTRALALIQDQLRQAGVEVEVVQLDFNTAIEQITSQTYDAYLLGWNNAFPVDPDQSWLFNPAADELEFGFNDTSYYNAEVVDLMEQARTLPGCDQEERAALYHRIQEILQNDQPYLWLWAGKTMVAAQPTVQGFAPFPNQIYHNVQTWRIPGG
ncbi:MAG: ABC transporter substrate-binding protein [bacterium]|nr:ABC transporter substrate-binding protein [bacterium]